MMIPNNDSGSAAGIPDRAGTWHHVTRWSLVLRAGASASPEQMNALNQLCQTYRPVVLSFVRSRGYRLEEAEDVTQNFFAFLLEKQTFAKIHPKRGRFRGFLHKTLRNFLANHWHKQQSQKNGGGVTFVSLDDSHSAAPGLEPADQHTPDAAWDYKWAQTVIQNAFEKLRADYVRRGDASLYEMLHKYLMEDEDSPRYAEAAKHLGKTEDAVKMAVKRLRERYADKLRSEIFETVGTVEQLEDEHNQLLAIVARGPQ